MKRLKFIIIVACTLLFCSCSYTEIPRDVKAETSLSKDVTTTQDTSAATNETFTAQTSAGQTEPPSGLPVIELSYEAPAGLRVFYVKSPDTVKGNNPLTGSNMFETLPVFINKYPLGHSGAKYEITEDILFGVRDAGLALAETLGLEILSQSLYSEDMPMFSAMCAGADITALPGYRSLTLKPEQAVIPGLDSYALGEKYTGEEIENAVFSIWSRPGELSGVFSQVTSPEADIKLSYNTAGELKIDSVRVFDSGNDALTAALNYNFDFISFGFDGENGALSLISFTQFDLREKLGDYPVISEEEAGELLMQGEYISTVTSAYLKNGRLSGEDIAFCELVYLKELPGLLYYIPVYRFYVELDPGLSFAPEGYTALGEFYVPAVAAELIRVTRP